MDKNEHDTGEGRINHKDTGANDTKKNIPLNAR